MRERFMGAVLSLVVAVTAVSLSWVPWGWPIGVLLVALAGWIAGGYIRHLILLAERDELTGLCNRRPLNRALQQEWSRSARDSQPMSLLFIEVDDFGELNKRFGHLMGDEALKEICRLMRQSIRRAGLLARWGGDEFVVVLPNTNRELAIRLAERIRIGVEGCCVQDCQHSASVTISTGVACYPGTAQNPEELLREAIQGQRMAKLQKNRVVEVSG